jgi:hypothetical protein
MRIEKDKATGQAANATGARASNARTAPSGSFILGEPKAPDQRAAVRGATKVG